MITLANTADSQTKFNLISGFAHAADDNQYKELRFNLAYSLQASLDIQTTLEIFFNQIQDLVSVSGLIYEYEQSGIVISLGKREAHTVSYQLASDALRLGSIIFSRSKRFTETELAVLEMLIGVLFFPLRNALLYREAVLSSMRDALTGVGNRHAMDLSFSRELKLANRHDRPLSILLIDIDHFKKVNDSIGHHNGDIVLRHIAKTIQHTLRETDQIFRYGGEEFVALLQNTNAFGAHLIAERLRACVEALPVPVAGKELLCTVSIGVCSFNGNDSAAELFEKADQALYTAKNSGRNRVEAWTHETEKTQKSA